jgi:hypothetical protein
MVGEPGGKAVELAHAHRRTVARCAVPKARGSCAANFLGDNLEWGYPKLLLYSHLIPTQVSQAADILSISKSTVHFAAGVIAVSIGAAMPVRFSIWPLPRVRQGFS